MNKKYNDKRIHVGDVVRIKNDDKGELAVVTQTDGEYYSLLYSDGCIGGAYNPCLIKTGRRVDYEGLLRQIAGGES